MIRLQMLGCSGPLEITTSLGFLSSNHNEYENKFPFTLFELQCFNSSFGSKNSTYWDAIFRDYELNNEGLEIKKEIQAKIHMQTEASRGLSNNILSLLEPNIQRFSKP